ncbi:MAG: nuclear transport factor 2 family protein, partial [Candidatus Eremiobacteraeota bacterium]|nr:nuclear transport factor 2 family protein [Candidatus Eremiobacteraeota bacterium]
MFFRFVTSAMFVLLLPVAATAAVLPDPIVQQVSRANAQVQLATKNHDVSTLDRLITPDYFLVSSNGHIYDRTAFLADIADTSATYEINQTEDEHIQHYNA